MTIIIQKDLIKSEPAFSKANLASGADNEKSAKIIIIKIIIERVKDKRVLNNIIET